MWDFNDPKTADEFIRYVKSLSDVEVAEQFENLRDEYEERMDNKFFAFGESYSECNRVDSVLPYDSTRVKLMCSADDYINASFITFPGRERFYIATQGPLDSTVGDFWQMVYEQRVELILMMTQCYARDQLICSIYWPGSSLKTEFGNIIVKQVSFRIEANHVSREFIVKQKSGRRAKEQPVKVTQLQYLNWNGSNVPDTRQFSKFYTVFRRLAHEVPLSSPILVHCSAGVGRTGATIAIDSILHGVHDLDERRIDVLETVRRMRACRPQMVLNWKQLGFIYRFIAIYLKQHRTDEQHD